MASEAKSCPWRRKMNQSRSKTPTLPNKDEQDKLLPPKSSSTPTTPRKLSSPMVKLRDLLPGQVNSTNPSESPEVLEWAWEEPSLRGSQNMDQLMQLIMSSILRDPSTGLLPQLNGTLFNVMGSFKHLGESDAHTIAAHKDLVQRFSHASSAWMVEKETLNSKIYCLQDLLTSEKQKANVSAVSSDQPERDSEKRFANARRSWLVEREAMEVAIKELQLSLIAERENNKALNDALERKSLSFPLATVINPKDKTGEKHETCDTEAYGKLTHRKQPSPNGEYASKFQMTLTPKKSIEVNLKLPGRSSLQMLPKKTNPASNILQKKTNIPKNSKGKNKKEEKEKNDTIAASPSKCDFDASDEEDEASLDLKALNRVALLMTQTLSVSIAEALSLITEFAYNGPQSVRRTPERITESENHMHIPFNRFHYSSPDLSECRRPELSARPLTQPLIQIDTRTEDNEEMRRSFSFQVGDDDHIDTPLSPRASSSRLLLRTRNRSTSEPKAAGSEFSSHVSASGEHSWPNILSPGDQRA